GAMGGDGGWGGGGARAPPPLVVDQMPPPTVPMKNLFALSGSAITGPIAPVTFPLGGASALLEIPVGPKAGAGPWVTKFWFTWTCANAAIGIVETDASSTQPTSRLNITPLRSKHNRTITSRVIKIDFS